MSKPITKGAAGVILEPRTIQSPAVKSSAPEINFSWTPQLIAYTLIVNGNIYPWQVNEPSQGAPAQPSIHRTAALQELTFTADVRISNEDFITEYEWDFGDGVKGYGGSVTHTYTTTSPSIRCRLCVTDNHGRRYCIGKPMNLFAADLTVVGGFSLVSPPRSADIVNESFTVSNIDTVGLEVGMGVIGDGIPESTTISSIINSTSFTMSAAATETATVDLWFTPSI